MIIKLYSVYIFVKPNCSISDSEMKITIEGDDKLDFVFGCAILFVLLIVLYCIRCTFKR